MFSLRCCLNVLQRHLQCQIYRQRNLCLLGMKDLSKNLEKLGYEVFLMNNPKNSCQLLNLSRSYSSKIIEENDEKIILVDDIINATRLLDVMVDSVPRGDVVDLISQLAKMKFSPVEIEQLLSGRVWLLRDGEAVLSSTTLLLQHGFGKNIVISVLTNLPFSYHESRNDLRNLPSLLDNQLASLRSSNIFTEGVLRKLLTNSPTVLFTKIDDVIESHHRLKDLFTSQHASKVLSNYPEIVTASWDEVKEKFDYAYFEMGCHQKDIVKSNLFSHSIEHIQDRHLFIFRTGNFVHSMKEAVEPYLNTNPRLMDIVDTSVEDFVKLCGVSDPNEFYAFLNIREIERAFEDQEYEFSDEELERVTIKKKKIAKKKKSGFNKRY